MKNDKMILTLCSICARQHYEIYQNRIKRIDKNQLNKEKCTYCNVRFGFDYIIIDKTTQPL